MDLVALHPVLRKRVFRVLIFLGVSGDEAFTVRGVKQEFLEALSRFRARGGQGLYFFGQVVERRRRRLLRAGRRRRDRHQDGKGEKEEGFHRVHGKAYRSVAPAP